MELGQKILNILPNHYESVRALAEVDADIVEWALPRNPSLLLLLAEHTVQGYLWPQATLLRWLKYRPKRLMTHLGYPPVYGTALRKLREPSLLKIGYVELLIRLCDRPGILRNLRHLETISVDVLLLAESYPELCRKAPHLVRVASNVSNDVEGKVFEDICVIEAAHRTLQLNRQWYRGRTVSVNSLRHLRARLETRMIQSGYLLDVPYPVNERDPGVFWYAVDSLTEMSQIAEDFNNCLMLYHCQLLSGLAYLYCNDNQFKEPCCVLVKRAGQVRWIDEIGFPNNAPIPELICNTVREHFLKQGLVTQAD